MMAPFTWRSSVKAQAIEKFHSFSKSEVSLIDDVGLLVPCNAYTGSRESADYGQAMLGFETSELTRTSPI